MVLVLVIIMILKVVVYESAVGDGIGVNCTKCVVCSDLGGVVGARDEDYND